MDKLFSIEEIAENIPSECLLALGGMTLYRRPMAFVRALIRRKKQTGEPKNLSLLVFTGSLESDMLIGAGIVSRVRTCYFGLEIFGLAPMFTHYANRGEIEIIEESEASLAFGLRASMADVGFMPGRGWLGTDLPKLRPDVHTILDPYSGEELMAFPAIKPDVAIIHAIKMDTDGNAVIGDNKGVDEELVMSSEKVFFTTEEIVPELTRANVVGPLIDGFALTPSGAAPTSCHPLYPLDGESLLSYTEQVSNPESFDKYLEKFLFL